MTEQPIIQVKEVTKDFDGKHILNNISLDVLPNQVLGIIGPSGSGKSVLLKTLIGYHTPSKGQIWYQGKEASKNIRLVQKLVGFSTQEHFFYKDLSPQENLRYFSKLYGITNQELKFRSEQLLNLVGLWDNKDTISENLSGGMQRRLDIAISLIHYPQIIIMDEPTSGLDPKMRDHIIDVLQKIKETGRTIILSSHYLDEIESICDSVALICEGKILLQTSPIEMRNKLSKNYEISLRTHPGDYDNILRGLGDLNIITYQYQNFGLILQVPQTKPPEWYVKSVLSSVDNCNEYVLSIQVSQPSLEKIFKELV